MADFVRDLVLTLVAVVVVMGVLLTIADIAHTQRSNKENR
jgi:hypothetical protein